MTTRTLAAMIGALALVQGCARGDDGERREAPVASAPSPVEAPAATPPTAPATTGRDATALRACELVPAGEVATATGGALQAPPGGAGPLCMFVVEAASETESYSVRFVEPAGVEAVIAYERGAGELGEAVAGPWDEAYLKRDPLADGVVLAALWRGDVGLEVKGDRREPVLAIAQRAAAGLPPR